MTRDWKELVGVAILGTDRVHDGAIKETDLLSAAAASGLKRQAASRLPSEGPAPIDECPHDSAPECVAATFELLTAPPGSAYIAHWLEAAAAHNVRLPSAALPTAFDWAVRYSVLVNATHYDLEPLGARGRWLAAQNPAWKSLFPPSLAEASDQETVWQEGSLPERMAALKAIRLRDASRGRQLLQDSMGNEDTAERPKLLLCLGTGLSVDDEDFLSGFLVKGTIETRMAARELLGKLPTSRFTLELESIAKPHIQYVKTFLGGKLEISTPPQNDPRLAALGIKDRKGTGYSERDNLLFDMVALVDPRRWSEWTGQSPANLAKLVQKTDFQSLLTKALGVAGKLHGQYELADLTVRAYIEAEELNNVSKAAALELTTERLDKLLIDIAGKPLTDYIYLELAGTLRKWSATLSLEILKRARASKGIPRGPEGMAYALHPTVLERALEPWPESKFEHQSKEVEKLRVAIEGRLRMMQMIKECAKR